MERRAQTSLEEGGGRGGAPGAATPSRQFAVFIVSGKQMTERKPSTGMGNQPGRISGSGRKENPFPERGACLRPGCASDAGSGVRGRGLKPGAHPEGKQSHHPRGWEKLCTRRHSTNMQIYVNGHANKQQLLRPRLGHFFWATAAVGALQRGPGLGMRGPG